MIDHAPALVRTHGPTITRRAVIYSSSGRPCYRGLTVNSTGRIRVLGEPGDITSVLLDFSQLVDLDETIEHVTITGPAKLQGYDKTTAIIAFNSFPQSPCDVTIAVRFSTHEQMISRFEVKQIMRSHEAMTTAAAQSRGTL